MDEEKDKRGMECSKKEGNGSQIWMAREQNEAKGGNKRTGERIASTGKGTGADMHILRAVETRKGN